MSKKNADMRDVPLLPNDMLTPASTMDRPLDTADAPGKADSEIAEEEPVPVPAHS